MPPKKAQAAQAVKKKQEKQKVEDQRQQDEIQDVEVVDEDINNKNATKGEKRKSAPTKAEEPEPKAAKTSTSSSLKVGAIIKFLLSDAALQLCQNEENASSSGKGYFSADLSPFEHLLCAVLDAGKESTEAHGKDGEGGTVRVEAMEKARTQHRQKTAQELGEIAQLVVDEKWDPEGDGSLSGLLEKTNADEHKLRKEVMKIKAIGNTPADIFLRRVQGCEGWEGVGWFIDGKTKAALEGVGLAGDGEKLREVIEGPSGKGDVRKNFVAVLEGVLGISLEGKIEELKEETGEN